MSEHIIHHNESNNQIEALITAGLRTAPEPGYQYRYLVDPNTSVTTAVTLLEHPDEPPVHQLRVEKTVTSHNDRGQRRAFKTSYRLQSHTSPVIQTSSALLVDGTWQNEYDVLLAEALEAHDELKPRLVRDQLNEELSSLQHETASSDQPLTLDDATLYLRALDNPRNKQAVIENIDPYLTRMYAALPVGTRNYFETDEQLALSELLSQLSPATIHCWFLAFLEVLK